MKHSQLLKKKILYIITQGETGGAQRYVFDLATRFRDEYEILVVTGSENRDLSNRLEDAGIAVRLAQNLKRDIDIVADFLAIWQLKKIFQDFTPDILHLNSTKAGFLGSIAGRLANIKTIIFTAHGFSYLEPHNWFVKKFHFWAEKFVTIFRTKVICVSRFDMKTAISDGLAPSDKFVCIHNGVNFARYRLTIKQDARKFLKNFYPLENEKVVGTIANFYKTKGLDILILAAKKVLAQMPNTVFFIIGDGRQRSTLEKKISTAGLKKNVILTGKIEDAYRYLLGFDLFVSPSLKEGLSYTILEAMATGLPIVATSVGGNPELITDQKNGLLVKAQDTDQLFEAIVKLLDNRELALKLAVKAKEQAREFTLEKTINSTRAIYEQTISKAK